MAIGKKILLIDDSPLFLEVEKSIFADLPHDVFTAQNGEEGLSIAAREIPDVVLLDEEMPDLKGHEVLERIRSIAVLRSVPVILVTGVATDAVVEQCMGMGLSGCIFKPFDPDELLREVGKALGVAERKAVSFPVRVRRGTESSFARALDLSTSGIRIESGEDFKVGDLLDIEFPLPGSRSQVTTEARIARVLPLGVMGGTRRFGVHFENPPEMLKRAIEEALGL